MNSLVEVLALIAIVGCGLVAGIFFAFSNFIMKALEQLPPNQGISAMKSINVTVLNRWFFLVFIGTGGLCIFEALLLLTDDVGVPQFYMLIGCATYLLGSIGITGVFNVPLNNRLASVDPELPSGMRMWSMYISRWNSWNTARTFASLCAAALLAIGLTVTDS